MKAVSFLGTTQYQLTTYNYEGHKVPTEFFAEALPAFFPGVDTIAVLVTPTVASSRNWSALEKRLGERVHPVLIPEGHTEDDLWLIFNALIAEVKTGERVVFDITNSFRSLPFLTFLAAAFLRTARQVKVERIVYGAFEARDRTSNETPVFDLTPFVKLLDWLTATNQFLYTGDAQYLARQLRDEGRTRNSRPLHDAGKRLQALSSAMMLCRPIEVMETADQVQTALLQAAADLSQYTQPFNLLAQRIEAEYGQRAVAQPTADPNVISSLRQQVALIQWYLDRNQIIQAMTLAREWLITAVGYRLGYGFVLKRAIRESARDGSGVSYGLSGLTQLGRDVGQGHVFTEADLNREGRQILEWPEWEDVRDLARAVQGVRNELDHAGMNPEPWPAATVVRKAQNEVWPKLKALAESWGLLPV